MSAVKSYIWLIRHPRFWPACFALFIAFRLAFIAIAPEPTSDAAWYFRRAAEIASGIGYTERGLLTAYWPVGYPGFLGALFAITGPSVLAAQLANLLLACGTFVLIVSLTRTIFKCEATARGAAALFALYPNNAAYTGLLMTEVLFTFFLLAGCWFYISVRSITGVAAAGIAFAIATLTKTQALVLPAAFFAIDFISFYRPGTLLLRYAVIAVAMLSALAPWAARNHTVFGQPFLATNGGMNLLVGNNASAHGSFSEDDPLVLQARFSVADQVAADHRARELALGWIRENPLQASALLPLKLSKLWMTDGEAEWSFQEGSPFYAANVSIFRAVRLLNQAFYFLLMIAAAAAVAFMWRDAPSRWAYLGFVLIGYFSLVSLVTFGFPRFHFPVMPFVCMYAAWTVARLCETAGQRRSAAATARSARLTG